ncbi:hypothetical protein G9A89_005255 [Geosiphon pyriformis]|nr:hypothetical protein G9A89_005255 [Geosiphon pyriformis]
MSTIPNPPPTLHPSEIDRCLELLNPSTSDEEKFVALMLLPRFLQQNPGSITLVFNAMDFRFLERLLRTKSLSDVDSSENVLRGIAVQIISCFCSLEELISKKQIIARIPSLANLITSCNQPDLIKDVLKVFIRLSSEELALEQLIERENFSKILICFTESHDYEIQNLGLTLIRCIINTFVDSTPYGYIISNQDSINELLNTIIYTLSSSFQIIQGRIKFDILENLVLIFSSMSDQLGQRFWNLEHNEIPTWTLNIRNGLRDILGGKIGCEQREKGLILVNLLMCNFGAEWLFSPTLNSASTKKIEKSPAYRIDDESKFAVLVVKLACIEIRMILDQVAEQQQSETKQTTLQHEQLLAACYSILERTIEYLSQIGESLETDNEESDIHRFMTKFDPDLLLQLKSTMTETFRVILEYLVDIKNSLITIETVINDPIVFASIRILSAWISEEDTLEKEVGSVIPLFIDMSRHVIENEMDSSLINILIPAFLNLTTQDRAREAFVDHDGHDLIINYIEKKWLESTTRDISDELTSEILGPLQILLNIIVAESESFIVPNENKIWKSVKIGSEIVEILVPGLKTKGYPLSKTSQIILIGNTLLFCLLFVSATSQLDMEEKEIAEKVKKLATIFYRDKEKLRSKPAVWSQLEELIFLGERSLVQKSRDLQYYAI